ncbi:hypothetical protein [Metapseudomonas otitidis]|uniref:hypothetical protein n=1 Tax=Metapseudomonas otitidis TaxID=319939 RepID=UPI00244A6C43|nr:hypothetical protein [Pseudomonas otitidis]MDH0335147.1 hypothetical protein [Pseudomonas otitidis]
MSDIDWSKAPEGATHCMPSAPEWYKQTDQAYKWLADGWALIANDLGEFRWSSDLIERPAAWAGDGLPPVGAVCEARHEEINNGLPVRAEILKHHANGKSAAFYWIDAPEGESNLLWAGRFFPIRTPEQIAEEERKAAIEEMAVLMKEARYSAPSTEISPYKMAKAYAEMLYQAGYRKAGDA